MPWGPVTGTAESWTSRGTSYAESYSAQTGRTQTWNPEDQGLPNPLRGGFTELQPQGQANGSVLMAFQVVYPGEWAVDANQPFFTIGSGLSLP